MFARVPEAVRRVRRHDEHLIRVQLHDLITGCPSAGTFEEDERLRVWMHMELHRRARRRPDDEDRIPTPARGSPSNSDAVGLNFSSSRLKTVIQVEG